MLGILLVVLANHRGLKRDLRNRPRQNVVGVLGLIGILATCYRLAAGILSG